MIVFVRPHMKRPRWPNGPHTWSRSQSSRWPITHTHTHTLGRQTVTCIQSERGTESILLKSPKLANRVYPFAKESGKGNRVNPTTRQITRTEHVLRNVLSRYSWVSMNDRALHRAWNDERYSVGNVQQSVTVEQSSASVLSQCRTQEWRVLYGELGTWRRKCYDSYAEVWRHIECIRHDNDRSIGRGWLCVRRHSRQ